MRRPHRSIEVFDISLMAVVTKAMGAFLVIMLLLMPYYSSGSIGEQSAADASKKLAQAQQQLQNLTAKLDGMDSQAILRALQEAQERLAEANRDLALVKRANDALNSQAQRLDSENSELREQVSALQTKQNKIRIYGVLTNSDCKDVRIAYGLMDKGEYADVDKNHKLTYLLNHTLSLGSELTLTDDDVVKDNPDQKNIALGHGMRFDHSSFRYDASPGDYYLVVAVTARTSSKIDGLDGHALKHVPAECRVMTSLTYYVPAKDAYFTFWIHELTLHKTDYAIMPALVRVDAENLHWQDPDKEAIAWLKDQIDHAQKIDADVSSAIH